MQVQYLKSFFLGKSNIDILKILVVERNKLHMYSSKSFVPSLSKSGDTLPLQVVGVGARGVLWLRQLGVKKGKTICTVKNIHPKPYQQKHLFVLGFGGMREVCVSLFLHPISLRQPRTPENLVGWERLVGACVVSSP